MHRIGSGDPALHAAADVTGHVIGGKWTRIVHRPLTRNDSGCFHGSGATHGICCRPGAIETADHKHKAHVSFRGLYAFHRFQSSASGRSTGSIDPVNRRVPRVLRAIATVLGAPLKMFHGWIRALVRDQGTYLSREALPVVLRLYCVMQTSSTRASSKEGLLQAHANS
jgi:hypothetical protein